MKIVWFVNITFPVAAEKLGLEMVNTGGWLTGMLKYINNKENIISVISFSNSINEIKKTKNDNIEFIVCPISYCEIDLKTILDDISPDIVHIHGTEMSYSYDALKAAKDYKTVVSIQGLIYMCAQKFYANLPIKYRKVNKIKKIILKGFKIESQFISDTQKNFEISGEREKNILKEAKNFIGRTSWDKKYLLEINENATYFKNNENLRDEFYLGNIWEYENCEKHSIFITQGHYPLKGFHIILKAFKIVKKSFPNAKLYTTGGNILFDIKKISDLFFARLVFEYQDYIYKLIKKLKVRNSISFLGSLDAKKIKDILLKANVFVLASSLENSSNSLGEAMILGVPCICSNVGGVKDMLTHNVDGILYNFGDEKSLAKEIIEMFELQDDVRKYSENAMRHAKQTHDREKNSKELIDIYNKIISS